MLNGHVLFAEHDSVFIVKMEGEIRFELSSALEIAVNEIMAAEDLNSVLLDMVKVTTVDSTILGVLAKMALVVNERFGQRVSIITASEDVYRILLSVGFDRLFIIMGEAAEEDVSFTELHAISEPERVMAERVLSAHKALIQLSEDNQEQFQDVVDLLEHNIKR